MRFVHLGIHTEFSITESIVRVPDLIKAAVNEEMPALALTDLSNLHAAVKFYGKCLGQGIKPILGSVLRLNDADHRVTLLSMNNHGWRNLTELVSLGAFRRDLLFRLNVATVVIPPLRDRPEDVLRLADFFLARFAAQYGRRRPDLGPAVRQALDTLGCRTAVQI